MIPLGCVSGRFQPLHEQHLELIGIALAECQHVIIAITNPDTGSRHEEQTSKHRHTDAANPFSYFERTRLINSAIRAKRWVTRTTLVPFNLACQEYWWQYVPLTAHQYVRAFSEWERQKAQWFQLCGYTVRLLNGDPEGRISASDIRSSMQANDGGWRKVVPAANQPLLEEMLAQREMRKRI
jgi:nicotinamide-nucleotide adenylyltransferase